VGGGGQRGCRWLRPTGASLGCVDANSDRVVGQLVLVILVRVSGGVGCSTRRFALPCVLCGLLGSSPGHLGRGEQKTESGRGRDLHVVVGRWGGGGRGGQCRTKYAIVCTQTRTGCHLYKREDTKNSVTLQRRSRLMARSSASRSSLRDEAAPASRAAATCTPTSQSRAVTGCKHRAEGTAGTLA